MDYRIGKPSNSEETALSKGLMYDAPLYVKSSLLNKKTEGTIQQEVFLGDIPLMTQRGTFIINGVERAVVNQLVRSPGVFFTAIEDSVTAKTLHTAEIRPVHGSWLEFSTTRHETVTVKIDRRRKFLASTFLRAIGISSNEIFFAPSFSRIFFASDSIFFKSASGESGRICTITAAIPTIIGIGK